MNNKTRRLLDLALQEAENRISEYTPADLNNLIKALSTVEKPEQVEPVKKLTGFLTKSGY